MDAITELGTLTTTLILAISFLGSFITAAFGIGGGLITLAGIASLLPPAAIIPVHGAVQIGSNAGRAALMFKNFDTLALRPFALGAMIGAGLGGAIVVELDLATLQITLGLFILWTIFFKAPRFLEKSSGLVGVVSSFLTMFVGGTGPFVITFIKTLKLDRIGTVATHAGFMTIQHTIKTLVFALLGFAYADWLALILLMIGAGLIGTLMGKQLLIKIEEARFKTILNCILTVLSIRLILVAIWPWFAGYN